MYLVLLRPNNYMNIERNIAIDRQIFGEFVGIN